MVFFRRIYGHCPFAGVVGAVGALGAVIDRFPQVFIDGKAAQQRVFVGYTTEIRRMDSPPENQHDNGEPTMNEDVSPLQDLADFPASYASFPRCTQYHHSSKESPFPNVPFLVSMPKFPGQGGRQQKTAWRVFIEKSCALQSFGSSVWICDFHKNL